MKVRRNIVLACGAATLLAVAPFVLYTNFLMEALCFALFASAFNLVFGYLGLMSFGHAMFFGGAAYATAFSMKVWGLPPEAGIAIGVVSATLLGFVCAVIAVRRQGIYFGMVTLALAEMFYFLCVQSPLTGGENGIQSVPRGTLFGVWSLRDDLSLYFLVAAIVLA